ncbi:hypothetical protein ACFOEY_15715 [Paracandidimonas soli]|uniref:hypothetical protein n=1 Tax=Paracandidimonas soli TaxID=1917182 RepID=UPI003608AB7C
MSPDPGQSTADCPGPGESKRLASRAVERKPKAQRGRHFLPPGRPKAKSALLGRAASRRRSVGGIFRRPMRAAMIVSHSRLKSGASSPQYGGACGAV